MSNTIHQIAISNDKEPVIPANLESIKEFFPKFNHIVWDYKKLKSFILKKGDGYILEAIDSIRPYAFKADIARYYIVYSLGGWYTDLNNFFIKEPPKSNNELIFFRDVQALTKTSWSVQCSLFYANQNHKILKYAVDQCVENVAKKYYGGHALCPTGPNLFGSIIARDNLSSENSYLIGDMKKSKKESGFYVENELFAKYKPNGLKASDSGIAGGNSYEKLWLSKNMYN